MLSKLKKENTKMDKWVLSSMISVGIFQNESLGICSGDDDCHSKIVNWCNINVNWCNIDVNWCNLM